MYLIKLSASVVPSLNTALSLTCFSLESYSTVQERKFGQKSTYRYSDLNGYSRQGQKELFFIGTEQSETIICTDENLLRPVCFGPEQD